MCKLTPVLLPQEHGQEQTLSYSSNHKFDMTVRQACKAPFGFLSGEADRTKETLHMHIVCGHADSPLLARAKKVLINAWTVWHGHGKLQVTGEVC